MWRCSGLEANASDISPETQWFQSLSPPFLGQDFTPLFGKVYKRVSMTISYIGKPNKMNAGGNPAVD